MRGGHSGHSGHDKKTAQNPEKILRTAAPVFFQYSGVQKIRLKFSAKKLL